MPLTPLQREALADELIGVIECYQSDAGTHPDRYEAMITQPSPDHLIIKLQPANASEPTANN